MPFGGAILGAAAGWYWAGGAGWATAGILLLGGWLLPVLPCLLASRPIAAGLATNVMFGAATFGRAAVLYREIGSPRPQDWAVLGVDLVMLACQSLVVSVPLARTRRRALQARQGYRGDRARTSMTNRRIGLHLSALVLLILVGIATFWFFHSSYAVPALIRALGSQDEKTRRHAAASLARLGPEAAPAVEALLTLAQPDRGLYDRTTAVAALVEVSPAAAHGLIPLYTGWLRRGDSRSRYEAAMVLAELGPVGKDAIPSLLAAARESDDLVRRWAVIALGRVGTGTLESTQALVAALADPSEAVRHDALLAFSYGFLPREALAQAAPAIRRLGEDKRYAGLAASALRSVDQSLKPDVEVWVQAQALKSGGTSTRYALRTLASLGPAAAPALPGISAALGDTRPLNRYLAAETLAAIGPAAAQALPALRARLSDEDALVRRAAAEAVAVISDSASPPATGRR